MIIKTQMSINRCNNQQTEANRLAKLSKKISNLEQFHVIISWDCLKFKETTTLWTYIMFLKFRMTYRDKLKFKGEFNLVSKQFLT